MRPELKGLDGKGINRGTKQQWLRMHRGEVEQYYHAHGPEATMAEFNMSPATLERFFHRKSQDKRLNKLSGNDKWVLKVTEQGFRDRDRKIRILEEKMDEVYPVVQSFKGVIAATLGKLPWKVEKTALPDDPLRLDNFEGKLK